MVISKKGAVAALKEAYKKGYEIVPMGDRIAVFTGNWALEMETRCLPLEVSQILVEHYEGIPVAAAMVQRDRDPQCMIAGELDDRKEDLHLAQERPQMMHRVPVTFRDKWAMFTTSDGEWLCIDQAYLNILEEPAWCEIMMTDSGMALFSRDGGRLTVAPGRFAMEDTVKLKKIAEMYREQRVVPIDIPENLCLFDDMERE